MELASSRRISTASLEFFNGLKRLGNGREQALGWRVAKRSWSIMVGEFGSNLNLEKARYSSLQSQQNGPHWLKFEKSCFCKSKPDGLVRTNQVTAWQCRRSSSSFSDPNPFFSTGSTFAALNLSQFAFFHQLCYESYLTRSASPAI